MFFMCIYFSITHITGFFAMDDPVGEEDPQAMDALSDAGPDYAEMEEDDHRGRYVIFLLCQTLLVFLDCDFITESTVLSFILLPNFACPQT